MIDKQLQKQLDDFPGQTPGERETILRDVEDELSKQDLEEIDNEVLFEIYRLEWDSHLTSKLWERIDGYFDEYPSEDFLPLVEQSIYDYFENGRIEHTLIESKVSAFVAQVGADLDSLFTFLEKSRSAEEGASILSGFYNHNFELSDEYLEELTNYASSSGPEVRYGILRLVVSNGTSEDICTFLDDIPRVDYVYGGEYLIESIKDHSEKDDLPLLITKASKKTEFHRRTELIQYLYDETGEDGILETFEYGVIDYHSAGELINSAIENPSREFLTDLVTYYGENESEETSGADHARTILYGNWEKSLPIILDHIEETDESLVRRNLRKIFREVEDTYLDTIVNKLSKERLTDHQRDALILSFESVSDEELLYSLDNLVTALGESTEKHELRKICICIDRLRYNGNQSEIDNIQTAVPDSSELPTPLPHLKDLIQDLYHKNDLDEISSILHSFDAIGSNISDEILGIIEKEKRDDIEEYREFSGESVIEEVALETILEEGEGQKVEFKDARVSDEKLMKEMVSLLNTEGGNIVIGVNDTGKVNGLENTDWEQHEPQTRLQNLLNSYIRPQPVVFSDTCSLDDDKILLIKIPNNNSMKPFFYRKEDSHERAWIRMGSSKIPANRRHLINLINNGTWF